MFLRCFHNIDCEMRHFYWIYWVSEITKETLKSVMENFHDLKGEWLNQNILEFQ